LDAWVDKYFGRIPKPAGSVPRATDAEPEWATERRYNETGPIVPFPAVAIDYLAPMPTDPDVPALMIAENILSGGESSRLYQELVRKQQIAQEASFDADIRAERGLLTLLAIGSENGTPEKMEAALLAEVKKMQDAPVSALELEKAKNQLISRAIRRRENNDGKAIAIEQAIAYQSDPNAVNSEIQKLQAVTAADIQRVIKKYIKNNNRVVIYYKQGEKKDE
jgi:zinc protease